MAKSLQIVPQEVLIEITHYLDRSSTSALARTNHHFHSTINPVLYNDNFTLDLPMDSCVLWAAQNGRLETVKRAHSYGANLEATGSRNDEDLSLDWALIPGRRRFFASGLHLAMQNQQDDVFYYLLENISNLDLPDRDFCLCGQRRGAINGETSYYPLHYAIKHCTNRPDLAKALINRGAYLSSMASHALNDAVEAGSADIVDMLLQHHKINATDVNLHGETALHYAARSSIDEAACRAMIRKFVEAGVSIDAKATNGTTALSNAFSHKNLTAIEELLDHGADPNMMPTDTEGSSPLHLILEFKHRNSGTDAETFKKRRFRIIQRLVEAGADINKCTGNNGGSDGPPLWLACSSSDRDLSIVQYLLDNGARTDIPIMTKWPDNDGARSIIAALFASCDPDGFMGCIDEDTVNGLRDMVVLLLQHGACIDEVEDTEGGEWYEDADDDWYSREGRRYADGDSALLYACRGVVQREPACLKMLLEHATRENVSLGHLREAMGMEFSDEEEEDGVDGGEEVQRMLREFTGREYPDADGGE